MISYRKSLDLLESIKDRASRDIMTRLKAPQQRFECVQCREKEIHVRHGAKRKLCSSEGCTNQAHKGGVCVRHGAKVKLCSSEGCTNQVRQGGACRRHGAKVKRKLCSREECTNQVVKGGVCIRHGANRKSK